MDNILVLDQAEFSMGLDIFQGLKTSKSGFSITALWNVSVICNIVMVKQVDTLVMEKLSLNLNKVSLIEI